MSGPINVGRGRVSVRGEDGSWSDLGETVDFGTPEDVAVWQRDADTIDSTVRRTLTMKAEHVDMAAMRALVGLPPLLTPDEQYARGRAHVNALTMGWLAMHVPPPAPRKRKGLTGKAYRIARRRHARLVKRLARLGPVPTIAHFPRVLVRAGDDQGQGVRGYSLRAEPIYDEAAGFTDDDGWHISRD